MSSFYFREVFPEIFWEAAVTEIKVYFLESIPFEMLHHHMRKELA